MSSSSRRHYQASLWGGQSEGEEQLEEEGEGEEEEVAQEREEGKVDENRINLVVVASRLSCALLLWRSPFAGAAAPLPSALSVQSARTHEAQAGRKSKLRNS